MLFAILDTTATVVGVTASDTDLSGATHIHLPDMTPVEAVLGRVWTGTAFIVAQPPVPPTISDRQFYQQLAILGLISQQEALAAVGTGAIPSEMKGALSGLPADQQFAATMKLTGATVFERDDPLVAVFAAAQNMTSAQLDALWQAAALL